MIMQWNHIWERGSCSTILLAWGKKLFLRLSWTCGYRGVSTEAGIVLNLYYPICVAAALFGPAEWWVLISWSAALCRAYRLGCFPQHQRKSFVLSKFLSCLKCWCVMVRWGGMWCNFLGTEGEIMWWFFLKSTTSLLVLKSFQAGLLNDVGESTRHYSIISKLDDVGSVPRTHVTQSGGILTYYKLKN